MRNRSETWEKLARHGYFAFDAKARINGKDYEKISAPKIDRALMTSPLSVGNCNAASLNLSILTDDEIIPGSTGVIWGRLMDEENVSEWKEFGTFFIDQRETSFEGLVTVECYDAMLKTNQDYIAEGDITGTWPKTMKSVVEEVAYRIGVGIDPRTRIRTGSDYVVPYPSGKTMAQVLGYIGACHGGNWIITEENLLRLVPLVTAPDETFHIIDEDYHKITTSDGYRLAYKEQETFHAVLPAPSGELPDSIIPRTFYITDDNGNRVVTPEGYFLIWDTAENAVKIYADESLINIPVVCGQIDTGPMLTVTKVEMSNESSEAFVAGEDTGTTLKIESNPYATQGICNDLYQAFCGLVYFPYEATKSLYDPAVELGDQVIIGDIVQSVVYAMNLSYDHNFRADLEAPNSEEFTSEYPYLSQFEKLEGQIGENKEELEKVTVRVERTEESLTAEISRAKGEESRISQYVDSITLSVSNGSTSSTISLRAGSTVISSSRISFSGYVEFSDLSSSGMTTISGDNITTGTINVSLVSLVGKGGGFTSAQGYDGIRTTEGAKMYGSDSSFYFIATNSGVRMQSSGTSFYCSANEIRASAAITESSDRNLKNSVQYDLERYQSFFMALKPAFFKFNDGTSDRLHCGYIAQEVEDAITGAGFTTKDFAGLVINRRFAEDDNSEIVTEYGLRYSEFIALNTFMVQKAFQ